MKKKKIKFKTESEIFSKFWGRKNELFNSFIKKELLKFDEKQYFRREKKQNESYSRQVKMLNFPEKQTERRV